MTGRPRRASTSSVETVDENRIQWRQETSVLKSVPKASNCDGWPIFELRNCVVLNKDGRTLENALEVGMRGPYMIRGTLIIEDPTQKQHLLMKVRHSIPIEIRQSTQYSIGQGRKGQPIVWISGKGGWYEITPSPAYLPIYNKMCEAVVLYYSIMDIYTDTGPKKSKKGKAAKEDLSSIFHKYSTMIGDGSTLEEVHQRCVEHAPFLISQFAQEGRDTFDWTSTMFYKWMIEENTGLLEKAVERTRNPPRSLTSPSEEPASSSDTRLSSRTRTRASAPIVGQPEAPKVDVQDFASLPGPSTRICSVSQKNAGSESITPPVQQPTASHSIVGTSLGESSEETPFDTVFNVLEWSHDELANSKQGLTVLSMLNKLYFAYRFPQYKNGPGSHRIPIEEVFHYNAAALLDRIDKAKYEKHEVYSWLQQLAQKEFAPTSLKPSDFPFRVVPRGSRSRQPKKTLDLPEHSDTVQSGPGSSLDDAWHNNTPPRVGKSIKRPGRQPGKSSLRLATSGKKRPHSQLESDSEAEDSAPKKSHFFHDTGDDVDDVSSQGESAKHEKPIKIVIRAETAPSMAPRGPDNTWTCDQEECDYVVRGGDVAECQNRIKRHFEGHSQQVDRVNLALTEGNRGQMPINHLLDKIKRIGEATQNAQQVSVNGKPPPRPIKRNLFV